MTAGLLTVLTGWRVCRVQLLSPALVTLSPPFSLVVAAVPEAERYVSLLREVAERTGRLVAHWQSLGFVHGQFSHPCVEMLMLQCVYSCNDQEIAVKCLTVVSGGHGGP